MKRLLCTLMIMLLCLSCCASAQEEFVFGGSENDLVNGMAVSADDRILLTGYTSSSDGTLESRTKSGRSGWALCVDREGNVLFSFCSRNGSQDEMQAPVFHNDGSVTVLLNSHGNDKKLIELIRLDDTGNVLSRTTLAEESSRDVALTGRAFAGGYVVTKANVMNHNPQYLFYDWDGKPLSTFQGECDGALSVISEAHAIVFHDTGFWLSKLDAQGEETPVSDLYDAPFGYLPPRVYRDMVSLDDGGAAAVGRANGNPAQGMFSRWAADGSWVSDIRFEGLEVDAMQAVGDGFALLMNPIELDYSVDMVQNQLYMMNGDGMVTNRVALPASYAHGSMDMSALSDGTMVVMQNIKNNGETDAMLILVNATI